MLKQKKRMLGDWNKNLSTESFRKIIRLFIKIISSKELGRHLKRPQNFAKSHDCAQSVFQSLVYKSYSSIGRLGR